jgi:phosphopantothenoylcysteine decarboxylase/phosphopantothenate--cysteine ligase
MADAIAAVIPAASALIMAAAPVDFRAAHPATQKVKKAAAPPSLELTATPDVLASTMSRRPSGMVTVGFALETSDLLANARAKLAAKQLDLIVANDALEDGAGFSVDTNRVTLIGRDGRPEVLPLLSKVLVADTILDRVEALLHAR